MDYLFDRNNSDGLYLAGVKDSYYSRPPVPRYIEHFSLGNKMGWRSMETSVAAHIKEYMAGYLTNEASGEKKSFS